MMFSPGPQELILIFLVVLLIFGGRKIPEIARGLGKGMREFKDGMNNIKDDIESTTDTEKTDKSDNNAAAEQKSSSDSANSNQEEKSN